MKTPADNARLLAQAVLKTGLSPIAFAELCGVAPKTVQAWYDGARMPGTARQFLRVVIEEPQRVRDILDVHHQRRGRRPEP